MTRRAEIRAQALLVLGVVQSLHEMWAQEVEHRSIPLAEVRVGSAGNDGDDEWAGRRQGHRHLVFDPEQPVETLVDGAVVELFLRPEITDAPS